MNAQIPAKILSLDDVVEKFHVSKSYLYKVTMRREVPFFRLGRKVFFDEAEISAWFFRKARVEAIGASK
jgi:excisionase family DNA binding protein